jgi:hypothetical protein
MFGVDDEIELWSLESGAHNQVLRSDHGTVGTVAYRADGTRLLVGTTDGTVEEWSDDGRLIGNVGSLAESIAFLRVLPGRDAILASGTSGALWLLGRGIRTYLGTDSPILSVDVSPDGRWIATADDKSTIRLHDVAKSRVSTFHISRPGNEDLGFSADGAFLAVATRQSLYMLSVPAMIDGIPEPLRPAGEWRWREVPLSVRFLNFSPDNRWFAATSFYGGIWINRRGTQRWTYISTGTTNLTFCSFSADSHRLVVTDPTGRALVVDMQSGLLDPQP